MRRLALAAAIGLAATAAAEACTSGYGTTGESSDAGADAPPPPMPPPADAGAGDADAAPRGPFCASKKPRPVFCADFDLSRAPEDGWSFPLDFGPDGAAPVLALDDAGGYSPPASFVVSTTSVNPGFAPGFIGLLSWTSMTPATATTLHVETKIRVDSIDRNRSAWVVIVRFGPKADSFVALQTSQQQTRAGVHTSADGGADTFHALATQIPVGAWTQVSLDFTFTPPKVVVGIDGATETVSLDATVAPGPFEVEIGEEYFEDVVLDATSIHFDDVLVDVH